MPPGGHGHGGTEVLSAAPRGEDELEASAESGGNLALHEIGELRHLRVVEPVGVVPDHDPAVLEIVEDLRLVLRRRVRPPGSEATRVPMRPRGRGQARIGVRAAGRLGRAAGRPDRDVLVPVVRLGGARELALAAAHDEHQADEQHADEQDAANRQQTPVGKGRSGGPLVEPPVQRLAACPVAALDARGSSLGHMAAKNSGRAMRVRWHPMCSLVESTTVRRDRGAPRSVPPEVP
jgi:hypothetical protein